jgi:16S rRNA (guanine527-N7)-methyltransferase
MNAQPLDLTPAVEALALYAEAFDRFAHILIEHNRVLNLTRIDTLGDIQTRHFLDSLAALSILDEAAASVPADRPFSLLDVGSGAGFPALALAIARPSWRIVSLEATEKKVRFQRDVCQALELSHVEILHGRAEVAAHEPALRERFDGVTARAVAPLSVLAELTLGFIRPGGIGLYWKGPKVQEEYVSGCAAAGRMGASVLTLHTYTLPNSPHGRFYLVAAAKDKALPSDLPRRSFGVIKKYPLSDLKRG